MQTTTVRLIFVFLLALNVVYAFYAGYATHPATPLSPAGHMRIDAEVKGVRRLVLGSEARPDALQEPTETRVEQEAEKLSGAAADIFAVDVIGQDAAEPVTSQSDQGHGLADTVAPDSSALDPGFVEGNESSMDLPATGLCVKVGPFAHVDVADSVIASMGAYISEGYVQSEDQEGRSVYWVHVPPFPDRSDAAAAVQSLAKRGIASFVIADKGPLRNGVSLGVFHNAESANRFSKKMGNIGFPVKVYRTARVQANHFVHASIANGSGAGIPKALIELVKEQDASAVVEAAPCDGVAVDGGLH
jgi:hypothetical protein